MAKRMNSDERLRSKRNKSNNNSNSDAYDRDVSSNNDYDSSAYDDNANGNNAYAAGSYERNYRKLSGFIIGNNMRLAIFKALYSYIPYLTAVIYFAIIIISALTSGGSYNITLKIILVPLTGFLAVTVVRKFINAPRPYTLYNITPIIHKDKAHESFPSRHTFSITIIAMAIIYYNLPLGAAMLVLAVVLGMTRIIAGVHFAKDVAAAWIIAVVWGIVGLWVI